MARVDRSRWIRGGALPGKRLGDRIEVHVVRNEPKGLRGHNARGQSNERQPCFARCQHDGVERPAAEYASGVPKANGLNAQRAPGMA